LSESTDSRIRKKYGEYISLSPNSERQLESSLLLKKKTLEDFSKVLPFSEECIVMVSSPMRNSSSITCLGLTLNKLLDRRLQTRISQDAFHAKSVHQARVVIRQRHIRVGKDLVNVPSFNVRTESEKKINLAPLSPFETNKPSRTSRKKNKGKKGAEEAQ
jgi:ribosomal protein S4